MQEDELRGVDPGGEQVIEHETLATAQVEDRRVRHRVEEADHLVVEPPDEVPLDRIARLVLLLVAAGPPGQVHRPRLPHINLGDASAS